MAAPVVLGGAGGEWLQYGVCNRPSRKNEDRHIVTASAAAADGAPWADFVAAVLDGHNGRRAAETCAARLVTTIRDELARLEKDTGGPPRADQNDAASPNWHPQARGAAPRARTGHSQTIATLALLLSWREPGDRHWPTHRAPLRGVCQLMGSCSSRRAVGRAFARCRAGKRKGPAQQAHSANALPCFASQQPPSAYCSAALHASAISWPELSRASSADT